MISPPSLCTAEFDGCANVTPMTFLFAMGTMDVVVATGGDVVTGSDVFNINPITLNERNLSALKTTGDPTTGGGSVILTLPTGFHWYEPNRYNATRDDEFVVKVDLKPMLAWNNSGFNPNSAAVSGVYDHFFQGAGLDPGVNVTESIRYDKSIGLWDMTAPPPFTIDTGKLISFSTVVPENAHNGEADDRMMRITLFNITRTSQLTGSVVISGLSFYRDDTVPYGTTAKLYVNQDESGTGLDGDAHAQYKHTMGVIPTNFSVAQYGVIYMSTVNLVSGILTDIPGETTLYEQNILPRSGIFNVTDYADPARPEKILGDGTDLIIRLNSNNGFVRAGGVFPVTLENAAWDFAGSNQIIPPSAFPSGAAFAPLHPWTVNDLNADSNLDNDSPLFYRDGVLDVYGRRSANPLFPGMTGYDPTWTTSGYPANYDTNYGLFTSTWFAGGLPPYQVKRTYYRCGEMPSRGGIGETGGFTIEIPYRLDITSATTGYVTILDSDIFADAQGIYKNGWDAFGPVIGLTYGIRIPLAVKTVSGDKNALVSIGGNTTNVTPQTLKFVAATANGIVATGGEVVTARNDFAINPITLSERNLSSLKTTGDPTTGGGSVILTLPAGFHWYEPGHYNATSGDEFVVKVNVRPMLAWSNNWFNPNSTAASGVYNRLVQAAGLAPGYSVTESIRYDKTVGLWDTMANIINPGKLISFSTVMPENAQYGEADDSMLRITLFNLRRTSQLTGSVVISGLSFYCDDTVPFGTDVKLYVNQDESGTGLDGDAHAQYKHTMGVNPTNFSVAERENLTPPIPSGDAGLASLSVTEGAISPDFDPDVTAYSLTVASGVSGITILAAARDEKATVAGAGEKALNYGENTFYLTVTAEDGTVKTYTVVVNREAGGAPAFTCGVKSMLARIGKLQQIPYTYSGSGTPEFTSSNTAVCGVTPDGTLVPMKAGIAVITIKAPGFLNYVFAVSVSASA